MYGCNAIRVRPSIALYCSRAQNLLIQELCLHRRRKRGTGLGGDGEVYKNRAFAVWTEHIIMQRLCFLPPRPNFIFFLVMWEKRLAVPPARSLTLCPHFML